MGTNSTRSAKNRNIRHTVPEVNIRKFTEWQNNRRNAKTITNGKSDKGNWTVSNKMTVTCETNVPWTQANFYVSTGRRGIYRPRKIRREQFQQPRNGIFYPILVIEEEIGINWKVGRCTMRKLFTGQGSIHTHTHTHTHKGIYVYTGVP
jgi:hypothetical protein